MKLRRGNARHVLLELESLEHRCVLAVPVITNVQGMIGQGLNLTIQGEFFGDKPQSKARLYANFEGGTLDPDPNLGIATQWDETLNAVISTTNPHSGTFAAGSLDTWRESIHALRYQFFPQPEYSSKMYISFWRRVTYSYSLPENWKWFRIWRDNDFSSGNYPDWYLGSQVDGAKIAYSEDCFPDEHNRQYPNHWSTPGDDWRLEEYLLSLAPKWCWG